MKFFCFEFKRFINNPKNKICLVLLLLLFIGLFILNQTTFQKGFSALSIETNQLNLQQSNQSVDNLKKAVELNPNDNQLIQELERAQEEQKIFLEQSETLKNEDYAAFTNLQYQLDSSRLEQISEKDSEEYKKLKINLKYYESVKGVAGSPSPYINSTDESAFTIGSSMMAWLSSTVIFVLLTVLVSDSISAEIESSQIRFYHLMGAKNPKNLLLKLCVPIVVTFSLTIMIFFCLYIIKGMMNSFGTLEYPYLTIDGDILPIWKVTLYTIVLYLVSLLFIASLGQFLGLVFKKSLVVIGLIVVCLTSFMTLSQEEWFRPFKKFFPFEYLGYGQVVNDKQILPQHAVLIGVCYLLIFSFLFIVISNHLYKNYYYRKG
ncbi:ABC transporter permease [Streptococcus himalayensis]|uniref:ABC transporter permease n=1 Tax=Streptococcus himalayensis TaxID=1888195 RepID=A0A917A778_9STRE|nr:ABC transporter permease [Streptococcus himalayensis]GGE32422.1 hypothetical protein GCM10011510_12150 [Streptococcus himalayensis]